MSQGSQAAFAFGRVAVVNRGEPAMRLINAVREWNEQGRPARPCGSLPCIPPPTGTPPSSPRPARPC